MTVQFPDDMPAEVREAADRVYTAQRAQAVAAVNAARAVADAQAFMAQVLRETGWSWPPQLEVS